MSDNNTLENVKNILNGAELPERPVKIEKKEKDNIKEISDAIGLKLLAEREEENIKFTITLKMHSDENISH